MRTTPTRTFQSHGSQPALVVTAINGLLEAARLYRVSNAATEREIIRRLGLFLDYVPAGETVKDWQALREAADRTHGTGDIREWLVVNASLPYPFGSASETVLHAFILIQAGNVAEAGLFEEREAAEAHGLEVCRGYFRGDARAAECESFDEIVELDADSDCSVYLLELRADGEPSGAPATRRPTPREPRRGFEVVVETAVLA